MSPDVWATVAELDAAMQARLIDVLEIRGSDPQHVETREGGYMLTVIDRGADILRASGQISDETAAMLKTEARQRIDTGTFFGHVAYASLIARKPS